MKRHVRVLLLGDERVGKSSIVMATLEAQPSEIPEPLEFPKELCFPDATVSLVDTFYRRDRESDGSTEAELSKADVVLLVYDITRPETVDRLSNFWLPLISRHTEVPVILVGNKSDLKPTPTKVEAFDEVLGPIAREWRRQVQVVLEVTTRSEKSISNLFYYAQRVVLCPTPPLLDSATNELTPQFKRALKYIFRKHDLDKDFALNDFEMLTLNNEVFHSEQLDLAGLDRLKEMIHDQCEDGVTLQGITFSGFLHLNLLMILRQKVATSWMLLRHNGFSDKLELNVDFEVDTGQDYELSAAAESYLTGLFVQNCQGESLSYEELKEVFSTVESPPWAVGRTDEQAWSGYNKLVETRSGNSLEVSSWLALWTLLVSDSPEVALRYLAYLGYDSPLRGALENPAPRTLLQKSKRKALRVFVIGASGVGKTCLLNSFIRRPFVTQHIPSPLIQKVAGHEEGRVLILKEFPEMELKQAWQIQDHCDLVLMLTDNSDKAERYLQALSFSELTPKILVQTKCDDLSQTPAQCISTLKRRPDSLFSLVLSKCISPWTALSEEGLKLLSNHDANSNNWKWIGVITVTLAIGAFVWSRYFRLR